jgi:hypothetical protein
MFGHALLFAFRIFVLSLFRGIACTPPPRFAVGCVAGRPTRLRLGSIPPKVCGRRLAGAGVWVLAPTALRTPRLGGRPDSGCLGDRCTARRCAVPTVECVCVARRPIAARPSLRSRERPHRRDRAASLVRAGIPRRHACVGRSTLQATVLDRTPLAQWQGRRRGRARRVPGDPRAGVGERRARVGQSAPGDRMCAGLCRRVRAARAARGRRAPSAWMLSTARLRGPSAVWPADRRALLPRAGRERFGSLEYSCDAAAAGQDLRWCGAVEIWRGGGGPVR